MAIPQTGLVDKKTHPPNRSGKSGGRYKRIYRKRTRRSFYGRF